MSDFLARAKQDLVDREIEAMKKRTEMLETIVTNVLLKHSNSNKIIFKVSSKAVESFNKLVVKLISNWKGPDIKPNAEWKHFWKVSKNFVDRNKFKIESTYMIKVFGEIQLFISQLCETLFLSEPTKQKEKYLFILVFKELLQAEIGFKRTKKHRLLHESLQTSAAFKSWVLKIDPGFKIDEWRKLEAAEKKKIKNGVGKTKNVQAGKTVQEKMVQHCDKLIALNDDMVDDNTVSTGLSSLNSGYTGIKGGLHYGCSQGYRNMNAYFDPVQMSPDYLLDDKSICDWEWNYDMQDNGDLPPYYGLNEDLGNMNMENQANVNSVDLLRHITTMNTQDLYILKKAIELQIASREQFQQLRFSNC